MYTTVWPCQEGIGKLVTLQLSERPAAFSSASPIMLRLWEGKRLESLQSHLQNGFLQGG